MFEFTPIDVTTYNEAIAKQSHRASEPRDTIYNEVVKVFQDAGVEVAGKGLTEDGAMLGFTWLDVPETVQDMILSKEKAAEIATIQSVINQTQNRDRWNVYCKTIKHADGSVGFVLVNEAVQKARMKAEAEAKAQAKADEKAKADAA